MIEGLQGVRVLVSAIAIGTAWYARALQVQPCLTSDTSTTFLLDGFLLKLDQGERSPQDGTVVYWAVDDVSSEYQRLVDIGSAKFLPLQSMDAVTRTAAVLDPFGNVFAMVERKDPAVQKARSQRVAEKVALRNVREALDDLGHADQTNRSVFRWVLAVAAMGMLLATLWLWDNTGGFTAGGGIKTFQADNW